jgi:hypothetical protein
MAEATIAIGKIVRSDSHVRYTCQVFGPHETARPPEPTDYAFGSFVRIPLRATPAQPGVDGDTLPHTSPAPASGSLFPSDTLEPLAMDAAPAETWAIGLIYDTILVNPEFGTLGPRLSSDAQVELFSPDYLAERAVLVSLLLLGTMSGSLPLDGDLADAGPAPHVRHGVPPIAPDLGAVVSSMREAEVRTFHVFADGANPAETRAYLHMGYLPHAIAQVNPLLPVAMLHTVERLEHLCPENAALLSIVKRNFAWRLKVETAG